MSLSVKISVCPSLSLSLSLTHILTDNLSHTLSQRFADLLDYVADALSLFLLPLSLFSYLPSTHSLSRTFFLSVSISQRFADLLEYVADVPGIERVRYVTSHPRYMSLSVKSRQ